MAFIIGKKWKFFIFCKCLTYSKNSEICRKNMFYGIKFLSKYLDGKKKGSTFALAKRKRGHASGTGAGEAGALSGISDSTAASRGISGTRSRTGLPEISEKIFLKKVSKKFAGMKNSP